MAAVAKHRDQSDVLLICWPVVTEEVLKAARLWGDRPIVYIGEVTDYRKGHLGGCASDAFFEAIEHGQRFESYRGNPLEVAMVCKVRALKEIR